MRTKIGKRIGPVPIALVAVFALAAFLSAGLLLTTNNGVRSLRLRSFQLVESDAQCPGRQRLWTPVVVGGDDNNGVHQCRERLT